jgi:hypothetical protein
MEDAYEAGRQDEHMLESQRKKISEQQAEIERLQDRNNKCIYLSDNETTEFCVDGACPKFKTEEMIKAEVINAIREKCIEHQDFHKGDDGVFRAYISIEDLDRIVDELEVRS